MRRETLYRAVDRVLKDLSRCRIEETIDSTIERIRERGAPGERERPSRERSSQSPHLEVFKKYLLATYDYSDAEKKVVDILGIDNLADPNFWAMLDNPTPQILSAQQDVRFVTTQVPKLLALLKREYVDGAKGEDTPVPELLQGKSIINVTVLEEDLEFGNYPLKASKL